MLSRLDLFTNYVIRYRLIRNFNYLAQTYLQFTLYMLDFTF